MLKRNKMNKMVTEKEMLNCIGKLIKVVFTDNDTYMGYCTEYVMPVLEGEEPTIFCEPHFAFSQSEIKLIEIIKRKNK